MKLIAQLGDDAHCHANKHRAKTQQFAKRERVRAMRRVPPEVDLPQGNKYRGYRW